MTRHTFVCVDGHTCGNPVRMVTNGAPMLDGDTMIERANTSWMNMIGSALR